MRPFMQRRYGNIIKNYVRNEIETRFSELNKEPVQESKRTNSVISLALNAYISSKSNKQTEPPASLDETFVETVINQVRLFLFAGNDTTSSTTAFCFHALAKHLETRVKMRQEHEALFGESDTAQMLKDNPVLLNQCPYTNAFIKETLRLYPPAANMRRGQPGKTLTALNGQILPTEVSTFSVSTKPCMRILAFGLDRKNFSQSGGLSAPTMNFTHPQMDTVHLTLDPALTLDFHLQWLKSKSYYSWQCGSLI